MAIDSLFGFLTTYSLEHPLLFALYTLIGLVIGYVVVIELQRAKARIPGITCPLGLLIVGNIHQVRVNAAEQYRLWSQKYGPVYQVMLGNILWL